MTAAEAAIVRERRIKFGFFLASLVLVFLFVTRINNMLVSLIFAVSIYYLLAPAVDYLERRGFSRLVATAIPFFTLTVLFVGAAATFIPSLWDQLKGMEQNADKYSQAISQLLDQMEARFSPLTEHLGQSNVRQHMDPLLKDLSAQFFRSLPDWISQSFTVIFLVPFFSFFLLLDGRDLIRKWLNLVPNNIFELTLNLNYQIGTQIGGFIRARLIQTLFVGGFVWIGLAIIGFPYALVLGILAGILNIIPYVGPVIAALLAILISVANGGDSSQIFLLILVYALSQILDAVILVPFLVARIVNLHPVTVIASIIVGAQLMGILGMIICIPVVSALKVTAQSVYKHVTDFRT